MRYACEMPSEAVRVYDMYGPWTRRVCGCHLLSPERGLPRGRRVGRGVRVTCRSSLVHGARHSLQALPHTADRLLTLGFERRWVQEREETSER